MVQKFFVTVLLFLLVSSPVFANSDEMKIFSDSNLTNQTTEFSGNQTVYIKIESDDPGEKEHLVRLKDNQYNDLSIFQLSREGGGPYIYKVSFAAPTNSGFYSIEATIASAASQNKLVKTIQVGNPSSANSQVNVRAQVKGTKSQRTQTPTPTPTPTSTSTPTSEVELPQPSTSTPTATTTASFWGKIIQFLGKFFKFFFRF